MAPARDGTNRIARRILALATRPVRSRGQALVELALILPVLLLLVAGAVDLGRAWYSQITLSNAAREGAMEAAASPASFQSGQPCDTVSNRVMCRVINEAATSFVSITPADVSMSCDAACTPGTWSTPNKASVTVTGQFTLVTPILTWLFDGSTVTLSATATATITMPPTNNVVPSPSPSPSPTATPSPSNSASPSTGATSSPTPTATPTATPVLCATPVASFDVSPTSGKKKKQVFTFTDHSTNMTGCNPIWSWNFGDGSGASSQQNPTYMWNSQGTYTVTLTVSNSAGSSSTTRTVNVTP